jgi:hypothetical protein
MDIVLTEWRAQHENEFADSFQSVYLGKDWAYGSFYAGTGEKSLGFLITTSAMSPYSEVSRGLFEP